MKFNSVVTNIEQDFTVSEKALGRKNIDAAGLAKYEIDAVEQWSGDLVLGQRTGSSMREIGVKLRDAVSGDMKVGYLVPPRTYKGMNLVCDASGNITWGVQPPQLQGGNYTYIDDHYHINVSGLQEYLNFDYTEDQKISGVNGSAFYGGEGTTYSAGQYIDITDENVINVTGLQPSGDYAYKSDLDDKLDTSAYHEYSAGQYMALNDYVFSVTGLQPELMFDYTDAGKISAINGSAVYGSEGGPTYTEGQYININDQNVISVTGLQPSGNYQPAGDYVVHNELSAYATNVYVNSATSGKLDTSAYTAPVQSDWTEDDNTLQSYILHKPIEIGLIAGSGVWFEDMTSAVKINCSATGGSTYSAGQYININNDVISVTGLDPFNYAVSGISGVSGIFIEDAGDHMNIGYSGSVGGAGGTSGFYTDLGGNSYFQDDFTFTYDGHFGMGSMEKAMVPVSNLGTDEGKVPVIYVRDGRSYYLLERIIPAYTSATNGKILGVQNNTLAWINNPVKIVADSADIPASGSSDNILYVVAAD